MPDATDFQGGPLLVLDGRLPDEATIRSLALLHSPVVAADGAALKLRELDINPDLIIGDLDTIDRAEDPDEVQKGNPRGFPESRIVRDERQDEYDGAKGLTWIVQQNHDRVTILGAGGGMLDHVLNNFSILTRFGDRLYIRTIQPDSVAYLINGSFGLSTSENDRISLIPMPSARLTTRGLFWELQEGELYWGEREGASNRATGNEVEIQVENGAVFLFHYADSHPDTRES